MQVRNYYTYYYAVNMYILGVFTLFKLYSFYLIECNGGMRTVVKILQGFKDISFAFTM